MLFPSNGDVLVLLSAEPGAAGPCGRPVLCLDGRPLTVSSVSPYTDGWEVSRPFPKSFQSLVPTLHPEESKKNNKNKGAALLAASASLEGGANCETGTDGLNLKCSLLKYQETEDGRRIILRAANM